MVACNRRWEVESAMAATGKAHSEEASIGRSHRESIMAAAGTNVSKKRERQWMFLKEEEEGFGRSLKAQC